MRENKGKKEKSGFLDTYYFIKGDEDLLLYRGSHILLFLYNILTYFCTK